MKLPLISVIVPAYNAEEAIGACLEALLTQSVARDRYEILVVDDGSTDDTAQVIRNYDVTLICQPNSGPASAKNRAVHQAKGEIVLFTDADCVPAPDWIETLWQAFADEEISGVQGIVKTSQKNLIARFTQIEYEEKYEKMAKQQYIDHIATGSAGYRKSVFLENGGFDSNLFSVEDIDLSFRLAGKGHKMIFCPEAVVYHRHPESVLAYARRKYTYGRWRVKLYRRYPEKVAIDSRTPQTQKIQIGLLFLLGVTLMGAVFFRSLLTWAGVLAILFLLSVLPFWVKAMKKDPVVGLISPAVLLVGTTALGLGLVTGIIDWGKEILQRGAKV